MGFEELAHTADYAIRVWADDLAELFGEAAHGLNYLAGVQIDTAHTVARQLRLEGPDDESLLVSFLSELVFLQEQENLAFDQFRLDVLERSMSGTMFGGRIRTTSRPIKAVTYHHIHIQRTENGLQVEIVFDV